MRLYDPEYKELRDTAIDIARSPDGDIGELLSLFPESRSVWEDVPLHLLNERQLTDLLNVATQSGELDREQRIQDACEKAWQLYSRSGGPAPFGGTRLRLPTLLQPQTLASNSSMASGVISGYANRTAELYEITINVPPGLQEREVKWLIEKQVRQQTREGI